MKPAVLNKRIGATLGRLVTREDFRKWLAARDGLPDSTGETIMGHLSVYATEPGAAGRCTKLIAEWHTHGRHGK